MAEKKQAEDQKNQAVQKELGKIEEAKKKESEERLKQDKEELNKQFLQKQVEKHCTTDGDIKVLAKDKAFVVSGKVVERFKKLRGVENSKFLQENFKRVWDEHDKDQKNVLEMDDAISFMEDLVE